MMMNMHKSETVELVVGKGIHDKKITYLSLLKTFFFEDSGKKLFGKYFPTIAEK